MRKESRKNTYRLLPQPKIHSNEEHNSYNSNRCSPESSPAPNQTPQDFLQEAIFAAGSFWRLEAAFGDVYGVIKTATGYYGGTVAKPSYREVCEGLTGHTEAVRVTYDTGKISFKSLCNFFFQTHDPTLKLYLEFGVGTHQRSAIFCKNDEQKKKAQESKVERQMKLNRRIVTKMIVSGGNDGFYLAENFHQKYFLQQNHVHLCEVLGLRSTDQFVDSHLACKLNGILSNRGSGVDQNTCQYLKRFKEIYDLPVQVRKELERTVDELEKKSGSESLWN